MNTQDIAQYAAIVLYLDGENAIDPDKSLFTDYGMTSLDFIDFAFELKGASNKEFTPDDLWPVNGMMSNPDFFSKNSWTPLGVNQLQSLFENYRDIPDTPTIADLYPLFTVRFVEHRLMMF